MPSTKAVVLARSEPAVAASYQFIAPPASGVATTVANVAPAAEQKLCGDVAVGAVGI